MWLTAPEPAQQARTPGPCHTHYGWLVVGTTAANSISQSRNVNHSHFVIAFSQCVNQAMSLSFFQGPWLQKQARCRPHHRHTLQFQTWVEGGGKNCTFQKFPRSSWRLLDDPLKHSLKHRRFTTKDGWRLTDPERNNPNKPLNGQKCKVEPLSLCWLLQIF